MPITIPITINTDLLLTKFEACTYMQTDFYPNNLFPKREVHERYNKGFFLKKCNITWTK